MTEWGIWRTPRGPQRLLRPYPDPGSELGLVLVQGTLRRFHGDTTLGQLFPSGTVSPPYGSLGLVCSMQPRRLWFLEASPEAEARATPLISRDRRHRRSRRAGLA